MTEMTLILDRETGNLLMPAHGYLPEQLLAELTALLGPVTEIGCARPLEMLPAPVVSECEIAASTCVRVEGYVHNSLVEGPGRRSSAYLAGCDLQCEGCWVPAMHPLSAGRLVPVDRLADALLDSGYKRDGVSILGGEPFQQPDGLLALVRAVRKRGCQHVLCYSGYTYEALCKRSVRLPAVRGVLKEIDVLIDGPYVKEFACSAGPWTGSGNQRIIDLAASRERDCLVCMAPTVPKTVRAECAC
jgi:anaerobic ribonucleoside-triphosphate reductase activating protein